MVVLLRIIFVLRVSVHPWFSSPSGICLIAHGLARSAYPGLSCDRFTYPKGVAPESGAQPSYPIGLVTQQIRPDALLVCPAQMRKRPNMHSRTMQKRLLQGRHDRRIIDKILPIRLLPVPSFER